jgi:DNA-binding transcriptional ArsR family regulator
MDVALRAIADPRRREILALVRERELPAGEIAARFDVTRPAISQHLKVLKDARLVTDQARGRLRLYRLDPAGFNSLRDYFDQFWTEALDAFAQHVEARATRRRRKP